MKIQIHSILLQKFSFFFFFFFFWFIVNLQILFLEV